MTHNETDLSNFPFCQSDFYNSGSFETENKRKPNFSEAEKSYLVEQFGVFRELLLSRGGDAKTYRKKAEIWQFIADGMLFELVSIVKVKHQLI